MLADNPAIGRSCDDIYPNGFYFPVAKHTAYFTKEDGFILVLAVLSQSQLPRTICKKGYHLFVTLVCGSLKLEAVEPGD